MHAYAAALGFIHIGRADALFGRADGGAILGLFGLAQRVQFQVPRQDTMAAGVDEQLVSRNALFEQAVDFAQDRLGVDDHARPDHIDARRIQDARGDELQLVFFAARDDRVARVVAALAAYDQIGPARENIDKFTLALVAPLRAEDHLTWHRSSFLSCTCACFPHVIQIKYSIGEHAFQS